jgi:hypothetical protein
MALRMDSRSAASLATRAASARAARSAFAAARLALNFSNTDASVDPPGLNVLPTRVSGDHRQAEAVLLPYATFELLLDEAVEDLRRIAKRSPEVVKEILRLLKQLDAGELVPRRLQDDAKTGDPTDCGKIAVDVAGELEHRIVLCDVGRGNFEVCEVITVEARTEDLAYLLAGVRLGRINDPVRRSDISRRIDRIQKALGGNELR